MTLECRIFKHSNDGKVKLVETIAHEEVIKTTKSNNKLLFNVHPNKNHKFQPRMKRKQK